MATTTLTGYFDLGRRLPYGEDLNNLLDGKHGVDSAVTALGTTLATAYALRRSITQVSVVTSGAFGLALPSAILLKNTKSPSFAIANILGKTFDIFNDDSADNATIFAPDLSTIDATAGATGVTLTHGKRCRYIPIAVSDSGVVTWISAQWGVVSA